jgi:hypothetical protein
MGSRSKSKKSAGVAGGRRLSTQREQAHRRRNAFRPGLENCEKRKLLSTVVWTGADAASDAKWSDSDNWEGGVVPSVGDTVVFDADNPVSTPDTSIIDKLFPIEDLVIKGTWHGTIEVDDPLTLPGGLHMETGTLSVHSPVIAAGTSVWSGGTIGGGGTFTNMGTLDIDPGSTGGVELSSGATLDNTGTIDLASGFLSVTDSALVSNDGGGVFDLLGDTNIYRSFVDSTFGRFKNAGTIHKASGAGSSLINIPLDNTGGAIDAETGTLKLTGGGLSTGGEFDASDGATLDLYASAAISPVYSGSYFGSGKGTVTWTGIIDVGATGAEFDFTPGLLVWASGIKGGALSNSGSMTSKGGGAALEDGATLNNDGTISVIDSVNLEGSATLNNHKSGAIDLEGDAAFTQFFGSTDAIHNKGLFVKSAGTGTSFVSPTFDNTGTVEVDTGTLSFSSPVTQVSGTTLTGGKWVVTKGATLTMAGNLPLTDNGADVTLSGAGSSFSNFSALAGNSGSLLLEAGQTFTTSADFSNSGVLTVSGGSTLVVTGTFTESAGSTELETGVLTSTEKMVSISGGSLSGSGTINGDVTDGGEIDPGGVGAAGLLTIKGSFTVTSTGALGIDLGGASPVTGYDQLAVTGTASLGGALKVTILAGFTPGVGETFSVLTFSSSTGALASSSGLDLGNGDHLATFLNPTSLVLSDEGPAPLVLAAITDQTVSEGSTVHLTASATDPDAGATLTYSLGPGAPSWAHIDPASGIFTATPPSGPATATVIVRVADNQTPALTATQSFTIIVLNVAPDVSLGPDASIVAGASLLRSGSFTDPGADTWTATVDYGDGTGGHPLELTVDKTFSLAHEYAAAGTYTVTVTVSDGMGGVGTSHFVVGVTAPVVAPPPKHKTPPAGKHSHHHSHPATHHTTHHSAHLPSGPLVHIHKHTH